MARAIFSGRHPSRLWPGPYFPAAIFRDYGPGHIFRSAILRDYGPGHIFRPPSFAIMARAIFSGRHLSRLWPGPYFSAAILRDFGPGHNFPAAILRDYGPGHIFRPPSFAIMARVIIFRPPSFAIMARAIFSGRHPSRLLPGAYFPAAIFRDYGPGHDQAPFFAPTRGPGHQSFRSFRSFRSNGATTGQTARDLPRG